MSELWVSYYLLDPFRSQGWQSRCTVHLKTRQKKEIMKECSDFLQYLKQGFCQRWGQQQILVLKVSQNPGRHARKQERLSFLRPQIMQHQVPAVLHSGTMEIWKFHPEMNPLSCVSIHILEIWQLPSLFGTLPASILVFMENKLYCEGQQTSQTNSFQKALSEKNPNLDLQTLENL